MKKVLIITTISGFLPQFEKNDVKILKEMGCEIHYASNNRNPIYPFSILELQKEGIFFHHIDVEKSPMKLRNNLIAVGQLIKLIEENDIDMIHCHNPMGGVIGRVASKMSKNKPYVIYTAHGFHFYKGAPIWNWMVYYCVEYLLARWTNQIVTINYEDYVKAQKFPIKGNGAVVQIHGVGVDKERFIPNRDIEKRKRTELGIPFDAFHIVTAAELNVNKNQRIIIEALAELQEENIYYSICGNGSNEAYLQELIKNNRLEKNVKLLGYRIDMEEILQTADCFAFPSFREGLGVAAIEALLCEVPLIVADNRGTREYIINGENGIVCNPSKKEEFIIAIKKMYTNENMRMMMKAKCRRSAEKFVIEEVEKTMREVYKRWINR